ncbi:MAG TPA: hypothetical protein VF666_07005 [Pyrinomonadaceae bacterium]|jgi:hypothetical protein
MSEQDKKEQAINPQPEYQEPSAASAPEADESRIGGQAVVNSQVTDNQTDPQVPGNRAEGEGVEQTGEGTGAKAGEYS